MFLLSVGVMILVINCECVVYIINSLVLEVIVFWWVCFMILCSFFVMGVLFGLCILINLICLFFK